MAQNKINDDPRIDPRIKALIGGFDLGRPMPDVASRDNLLREAASPEAAEVRALMVAFMEMCDTEEIAPSKGVAISEHSITSQPDGNTINVRVIRPESDAALPCVYYIHGGGMASMSCYDGNYRAWGRILAAQGVAVAMVDFRNSVEPSTAEGVAPYPAGLNDCVSGLKWVAASHAQLGIDPGRIIVAGESGGGNLTLATGCLLYTSIGGRTTVSAVRAAGEAIAGIRCSRAAPHGRRPDSRLAVCRETRPRPTPFPNWGCLVGGTAARLPQRVGI